MPLHLVDTIGFMTPCVVRTVAYAFFGPDALGDKIKEPSGTRVNGPPLDAICRTIEIKLRESLDKMNLPEPL